MARKSKVVLDDAVLDRLIRRVGNEHIDRWVIHDGVEYGVHQELTDRGHPSLVPAYEGVTRPLFRAIGRAIERIHSLNDVLGKAAFDIQNMWAGDVNVDTGAYKGSITVSKG